ncbi:hypothetical protein SAMN02746041_03016 [Desulfacinum hydrothermale DSM 13146]|uniref:Uncharacterized protein n=1 Tax=Desulfacinum hydrothermale DSM 13146 TaxID=1121390 RepID=A0A1W1XUI2_9BACT|nr:hypothetical protein SAMN02746041_03016 [Desulfacinum hydrothermale DSM 13146]
MGAMSHRRWVVPPDRERFQTPMYPHPCLGCLPKISKPSPSKARILSDRSGESAFRDDLVAAFAVPAKGPCTVRTLVGAPKGAIHPIRPSNEPARNWDGVDPFLPTSVGPLKTAQRASRIQVRPKTGGVSTTPCPCHDHHHFGRDVMHDAPLLDRTHVCIPKVFCLPLRRRLEAQTP